MAKAKKAAVAEKPVAQNKFEDFDVEWSGLTMTVPARSIVPIIGQMEGVLTLQELADGAKRGSIPTARVAMSYGILLRAAGYQVSDEHIYQSLAGKPRLVEVAILLMNFMAPPWLRGQALLVANQEG